MIRLAAAILLLLACGTRAAEAAAFIPPPAASATVDALPAYVPDGAVAGPIRLWGHGSFRRAFMGNLLRRWAGEFAVHHPRAVIENRMYGTASAVGALYSGAGDIALLGEEISPAASLAFRRARGYAPTVIEVATGSLDVNYFDYAHMVLVHADNPLAGLSLPQLASILGAGSPAAPGARTWGAVGLGGDWAGRPITPHSWKVDEDFALFLRGRVMDESHRWNPSVREYVHGVLPDGTQHDHGQQIAEAVARDRGALGISNVRYLVAGVRVLPLSWRDGGPLVLPTPTTLIDQSYPLVRIIPAVVDHPPGQPLAAPTREFLRFVLSREGQRALIEETGYLPLGPAARARQLEKLR